MASHPLGGLHDEKVAVGPVAEHGPVVLRLVERRHDVPRGAVGERDGEDHRPGDVRLVQGVEVADEVYPEVVDLVLVPELRRRVVTVAVAYPRRLLIADAVSIMSGPILPSAGRVLSAGPATLIAATGNLR